MDAIEINNKTVGEGCPCFIIAEAGVNHNGRLDIAEKLVDVAVDAGADAVKFQTFRAEDIVIREAGMISYQKKNIGRRESQQDMLRKLELSYGDFKELKAYCDDEGITFLSTPHSEDAIDFLDDLVPAYKIGSGDLTNAPFLKKVAGRGKPIILGTGMSTLQEVKDALNVMYSEGNKDVVMLHCTTNYPCPTEDVNLRAMLTLQKELDCLVGYSDHTLGVTVPIMAVTLGAVVIEKHFTLDRSLSGPDHKASVEPDELKEMVERIREVEVILGSFMKKPTESEKKMIKSVRKSLVAKVDIKEGTQIKREMLAIKRPGTGIIPKEINTVVGRFTRIDIKRDELITWSMLK